MVSWALAGIAHALGGIEGLDLDRLLGDMDDPHLNFLLQADWEQTRSPRGDVIGLRDPAAHPGGARTDGERLRYVFPTLVISGPAGDGVVPGWRPLQTYSDAINEVAPEFDLRYHPLAAASARSAALPAPFSPPATRFQ